MFGVRLYVQFDVLLLTKAYFATLKKPYFAKSVPEVISNICCWWCVEIWQFFSAIHWSVVAKTGVGDFIGS